MTTGTCAVVWIDEQEGRIAYLGDNHDARPTTPGLGGIRLHRRARATSPQDRRATDDHVFYQKIANDLASVHRFLVLGPADAKTRFLKHLHRYDPRLIVRLSAIESTDHLTNEELVATAQAHFRPAEPQIGHAPAFWSI